MTIMTNSLRTPTVPPAPVGGGSPATSADATFEVFAGHMDTAMRRISEQSTTPPRAARAYAALSTTMARALDVAREGDAPVDDRVLLDTAAARILAAPGVFPATAAGVADAAAGAHAAGSPGVDEARRIAGDVADSVLATFAADRADASAGPIAVRPGTPGRWEPRAGLQPIEPQWGSVQPLHLPDITGVERPVVPAWDGEEFTRDRDAFRGAQRDLTDEQRHVADHWGGGPGTPTPSGHWIQRAVGLARESGLPAEHATDVVATTAAAMHNAFVGAWKLKYDSMVARPDQWMADVEPGWTPYMGTPHFPSFPSGHATISGAAAEVLARALPAHADQVRTEAVEAAQSRVYGGIHWSLDGTAGVAYGARIAAATLAAGAPLPPAAPAGAALVR